MSDEHAKAKSAGAAPTRAAAGALEEDGATLVAPSGLVAGTSLAPATASAPSLAPSSHELVAGRYEILGLIGSGGMGTVYRARDRELDELVALKVLRHELASTPDMLERFRREVKLARRVTHRNVARVFDIGEHGGEKFLTMELVEGDSLGALLERERRLSLGRAVEIARGICAGLASAHAAGVVHRDLKPDNVLIARDGRVVVSDFGIARALVAGSSAETMGSVVGTPAYMAPEQVEGRHDVDHRADIYAFGALFYEMLVGERAWPGDAPLAVAAARLLSPPPDPRAIRPELPAACAELVHACLARRPEDRIASIAEVETRLAAVVLPTLTGVGEARGPGATLAAGPRARQPDKTVAVLPFRNTGGPEDAYLADELTDDLIDGLSMTPGLRVSARGAVARYRGADGDPRDIGRDLGVRVVVEGSVRRTRAGLRVTARLVSVADGFQLWAKRFDRPAEDALAVNDEAAAAIAEALTVEHQKCERDAPSDPRAVDLYLRARHEYRKFWPDHQRRAIELFDQALALAPRDPLVLSGLALALARNFFFTGEGEARAREIAAQAVAAADELPEPHLALGSVALQVGDHELAARELRRAILRGPRLAEALAALGRLLVEAGETREGTELLERALELDPEVPLAASAFARSTALDGDFARSDALVERMLATESEFSVWVIRARLLMWRRDAARAEVLARELEARADFTLVIPLTLLRIVAGGSIAPEVAALLVPKDGEGSARRRAFFCQLEAEVTAYVGRPDVAEAALGRAVDAGLIDLAWVDRCPLLAELRSSPGFVARRDEVARRAARIVAAARAG